jgi:hypothetical protein
MQKLPQIRRVHAPSRRYGLEAIGLTVAVGGSYLLAAMLSLALLTKPDGVAVFWPAAGIASGTLIALGSGVRVPVALGVVAASIVASILGDRNLPAALVFGLCNAAEPLLVAWLIKRHFGEKFRLDSLGRLLGFLAAAGIAPAVSGSVATVGFILFYSSGAPVLTTWLNWFASDALGIIMVAPVLIGLGGLRGNLPQRWEVIEGGMTLVALVVVSAIAFGSPAHQLVHGLPSRSTLGHSTGCPLPAGVRCSRSAHSRFRHSLDDNVRTRWLGRTSEPTRSRVCRANDVAGNLNLHARARRVVRRKAAE